MRRRALVTVLVALALLLIASTIKSGWLYLVASALLSLVVLGFASGRAAVRRVSLERQAPPEVFEGEPFTVRLKVANRGRLASQLLSIRDRQFAGQRSRGAVEERQERREQYRQFMRTGSAPEHREPKAPTCSVAVERLDGGTEIEASYEVTPTRRGFFGDALMELESGGMFGSAVSRREVRAASPVLVFPRVYPLEWFPLERRTISASAESFEWTRKGIGQDYYGIREYASGDSLRHVHWKSSARLGRLIVKEYQQEFRPTAGLVLALAEPAFGDLDNNSLEDGLRSAASVADYFHSIGTPPWMVLPTGGSFHVLEPRSLHESLKPLALYQPPHLERESAAGFLDQALLFARTAAVGGAALVLVTNLRPEEVLPRLGGAGSIVGVTALLVLEESYSPDWDPQDTARRRTEIGRAAGPNLTVLTVTNGTEIGTCLAEPLSTIAL